MKSNLLVRLMVLVGFLLFAFPSHAQSGGSDVYWHVDGHVTTCSMVIDPSLTQAQWKTFTRQTGGILSFKSLASAEPLGKGRFTLGVDYSITPVDQHDPAWINTFTHPDQNCPLGDQIETPTLRARAGVTSKMDVGAYWTTAPGANYGFVGGELKYAFLPGSAGSPAVAVATSFAVLTGVPDFNMSTYGLGLVTSKRFAIVTPYLGVRENLTVATETTTKVQLEREDVFLTQGFLGASGSVWKLNLAAEYNLADVSTFVLAIAFHP